ncbi:hypothetical protein LCGC14_3133460 [marine sediment metagenome]|uniref:Uncharacterized protein n=1 Tax=marine sediment metagenome TaxID=412755 RepID=A0A0F8VZ02_9ZZZZ
MLHFVGTAIYNFGLSNATFIIDNYKYVYHTDTYHVDKCKRISRYSNKRALNYIKKHSLNVIKIREKNEPE